MSTNNSPSSSPARLSRASSMLTSMLSLPYTVVNTAYKLYNQLNPVTLAGAVDIVVVQQPDGSLKCSPFHVRFGKLAVLHMAHAAHGKLLIDVQINGEPIDCDMTNMLLGENGEAYFHAGGEKCMCREPVTPQNSQQLPGTPTASIVVPQSLLHEINLQPRAESVASRDSGHISDEEDDENADESDDTLQFSMDVGKSRPAFLAAEIDEESNSSRHFRSKKNYLRKRRLSRSTTDLSVFLTPTGEDSEEFGTSSNLLAKSSTSLSPTTTMPPALPSVMALKSFASIDESVSSKIITGMSASTTAAQAAAIGSCCKCKTKTLNSDRLAFLHLRSGRNDAEFSVVTRYQGTATVRCHIYLWRYDERIVISDVDGTITQSDVLGYLAPIIGAQWAQAGITHLYDRIKENGYKIVYLTARAVGQSQQTRYYLSRVKQERNMLLPDGPLLLWPDSVWSAFRSEVVERRPDRFKTQCLKELRCLFPPDRNPFWAGYGNRVTDFVAYQAAGVPSQRIFMVNHLGELWQHTLHHNMATFHAHARDDLLVDALFPAISSSPPCDESIHRCTRRNRHGSIDVTFANFNYWNFPPPTILEENL